MSDPINLNKSSPGGFNQPTQSVENPLTPAPSQPTPAAPTTPTQQSVATSTPAQQLGGATQPTTTGVGNALSTGGGGSGTPGPAGPPGPPGPQGPAGPTNLSNANPQNVGVAAPGVGTNVSRDDHVHALPAVGPGAGTIGTGQQFLRTITLDANGRVTAAAPAAGQGWFNVVDYGAVGDGTTDDGPAFQAAFDACTAAGGGVVYVPRCSVRYHIVTNIIVSGPPNQVTWLGSGYGGRIFFDTGTAHPSNYSFSLVSAVDFQFNNLYFQGQLFVTSCNLPLINMYVSSVTMYRITFDGIRSVEALVKNVDGNLVMDQIHFFGCTTTTATANDALVKNDINVTGFKGFKITNSTFDDVDAISSPAGSGSYILCTDPQYPEHDAGAQITTEIGYVRMRDNYQIAAINLKPATTARFRSVWIHDFYCDTHDGVAIPPIVNVKQCDYFKAERGWNGWGGVATFHPAYNFTDAGQVIMEQIKTDGDYFYTPPPAGALYFQTDSLTLSLQIIDCDYVTLNVSCPTTVMKDGILAHVRNGSSVKAGTFVKPNPSTAEAVITAGTGDTPAQVSGVAVDATAAATGTMIFDASKNITEGDTVPLMDGVSFNAAVAFTLSGASYPGDIVVSVNNGMTADQRATATANAINAAHGLGTIAITAAAVGGGTGQVKLTNDFEGIQGNLSTAWRNPGGSFSAIPGAISFFGMGGGQTQIRVAEIGGQQLTILSDGTTTIAPGDTLDLSTTVAGYAKKSAGAPIALAYGNATNVLGTPIKAVRK